MEILKFGKTRLGLPIHAFALKTKPSDPHVLLMGGVHGDEPEGVVAARALLEHFRERNDLNLNVTLIPEFNPEGVLLKTRGNASGVDLNRNLPTKDWSPIAATVRYMPGPYALSEPENQALVEWLAKNSVQLIISLHSWKPMLNVNGEIPEAEVIAKLTGYTIEPDIGYPTPGSLGTFAGHEKNIPTLTYEIERGLSFDQIIQVHVPAILAALDECARHRRSK